MRTFQRAYFQGRLEPSSALGLKPKGQPASHSRAEVRGQGPEVRLQETLNEATHPVRGTRVPEMVQDSASWSPSQEGAIQGGHMMSDL